MTCPSSSKSLTMPTKRRHEPVFGTAGRQLLHDLGRGARGGWAGHTRTFADRRRRLLSRGHFMPAPPLCRPHPLLRELAVERRSWGQQPRLREGRGSPHWPGECHGSLSPTWGWLLQCWGLYYALHCMLMACPNQDGTQQGQHGGSCDDLADNDLGIGSGWVHRLKLLRPFRRLRREN